MTRAPCESTRPIDRHLVTTCTAEHSTNQSTRSRPASKQRPDGMESPDADAERRTTRTGSPVVSPTARLARPQPLAAIRTSTCGSAAVRAAVAWCWVLRRWWTCWTSWCRWKRGGRDRRACWLGWCEPRLVAAIVFWELVERSETVRFRLAGQFRGRRPEATGCPTRRRPNRSAAASDPLGSHHWPTHSCRRVSEALCSAERFSSHSSGPN